MFLDRFSAAPARVCERALSGGDLMPLRVFAFSFAMPSGRIALDQVACAHGMLDAADGWGESFDRRKRVRHSPRLFSARDLYRSRIRRSSWTRLPSSSIRRTGAPGETEPARTRQPLRSRRVQRIRPIEPYCRWRFRIARATGHAPALPLARCSATRGARIFHRTAQPEREGSSLLVCRTPGGAHGVFSTLRRFDPVGGWSTPRGRGG